jgi:hypothetical protein
MCPPQYTLLSVKFLLNEHHKFPEVPEVNFTIVPLNSGTVLFQELISDHAVGCEVECLVVRNRVEHDGSFELMSV